MLHGQSGADGRIVFLFAFFTAIGFILHVYRSVDTIGSYDGRQGRDQPPCQILLNPIVRVGGTAILPERLIRISINNYHVRRLEFIDCSRDQP
jgi:hypothetical protein